MAREPIVIEGSHSDPEGTRLSAVIDAHFRYTRLRSLRQRSVHLLAVLGAAVWMEAAWPRLFSSRVDHALLLLWPACLLVTLGLAGLERHWYVRRMERIAGQESTGSGPVG